MYPNSPPTRRTSALGGDRVHLPARQRGPRGGLARARAHARSVAADSRSGASTQSASTGPAPSDDRPLPDVDLARRGLRDGRRPPPFPEHPERGDLHDAGSRARRRARDRDAPARAVRRADRRHPAWSSRAGGQCGSMPTAARTRCGRSRRRTTARSCLGELALVDGEGRIGPLGTVFYETLIDENAASHIALGSGTSSRVERRGRSRAGQPRADPRRLHDRLPRARRRRDHRRRRPVPLLRAAPGSVAEVSPQNRLGRDGDRGSLRPRSGKPSGAPPPQAATRVPLLRRQPGALGRTGCSGGRRGALEGVQARNEVEGHVDPGRDPRRSDDLAAVDKPVVGSQLDGRLELGEPVEPPHQVVAGRSRRRPAAASTSAPVQTLVTSAPRSEYARSQSSAASSSCTRRPARPGRRSTSAAGAVSHVWSAATRRPFAHVTGPSSRRR